MSQELLFKPLTKQSKAAVVETANALMEWGNNKNLSPHLKTAIIEYYEQLAKLAKESSLIEQGLLDQLVIEREIQNDRDAESITKSDV